MTDIGFLLFALAVFAAGYTLSALTSLSAKSFLTRIAPLLESPQIQGLSPARIMGKFEGYSLSIEISKQGRNQPLFITVTLFTATPFSMKISPEGGLQKLGKDCRLLSEVEIGEPDFDERYLIETAARQKVANALSPQATRDIVDGLFHVGYSCIDVHEGAVCLSFDYPDLSAYFNPDSLRIDIKRLISLAEALSQAP
ncbi:MAG: hypothetical protein RDV48_25180 [Candidatus Eremiobacteraeota bacterium]|nr:hypothetical protein [Candidatus Eremiobacteraeota bacterium]